MDNFVIDSNVTIKKIATDGTEYDNENVLPAYGHILPFAGPIDKIPTGWAICDGTNGTPDLRERYAAGHPNVSVGSNFGGDHSHNYLNFSRTPIDGTQSHVQQMNSNAITFAFDRHTHPTSQTFGYRINAGASSNVAKFNGNQASIAPSHLHSGYTTNFPSSLNNASGFVHFLANTSSPTNDEFSHTHASSENTLFTNFTNHSHTINSEVSKNILYGNTSGSPKTIFINFIMKVNNV
jgi:hypothetical protein